MTENEKRELVTLREYLEHKVCALDVRIDERFVSRDKSLALQAGEYQRRLEALNHEQARLAADRERFMPREVSEARHNQAAERISLLSARLDKLEGGKASLSNAWTVLVAILMAALAAIGFFWRH